MAKQEIQVTGIDALNTEVRNAIELNKKNTVVSPDLAKKILVELNQEPPQNEIQINKMANNSKYLPISFIETKLDELFYGLWNTKNFRTLVVANEITGCIDLEFYAPWADRWITRTGCGSVQIQLKSIEKGGSGNITHIEDKIANTLTKDYPHLKAECIKNACRSIGKIFGRDLNRKFEDFYNPMESMEERIEANNPKYLDADTIKAIQKNLLDVKATEKQIKWFFDVLKVTSFDMILESNFEKANIAIEKIAKANKEKSNGN